MTQTLTRDDIRAIAGPVDDVTAAEIVASGATKDELAEAQAWVVNDEAMMNDGRRLAGAGGRVGRLVELLSPPPEPDGAGRLEP